MAQKPDPHYTDLSAAMRATIASHTAITDEIHERATHHVDHIARMREARHHANLIQEGAERQVNALQSDSTQHATISLRLLDSNN